MLDSAACSFGGSRPNLPFDSAERRGFPEPTRPGAEARRKRVEVRAEKRRQTGKYSPALHEEGHFSLCGDISAQSVRCRHALQQPPQPPRPQGSRRIAAACFEGTNQKAERGRVRRPRPRAAPGPPPEHATCARGSVSEGAGLSASCLATSLATPLFLLKDRVAYLRVCPPI